MRLDTRNTQAHRHAARVDVDLFALQVRGNRGT
jgi:hypothetical protein